VISVIDREGLKQPPTALMAVRKPNSSAYLDELQLLLFESEPIPG
jgi:hypothetical protein